MTGSGEDKEDEQFVKPLKMMQKLLTEDAVHKLINMFNGNKNNFILSLKLPGEQQTSATIGCDYNLILHK